MEVIKKIIKYVGIGAKYAVFLTAAVAAIEAFNEKIAGIDLSDFDNSKTK